MSNKGIEDETKQVSRHVMGRYEKATGFGDKYPKARILTFDVESVSPYQAIAHLALNEPFGYVVEAGERGPKGGWGKLTYVTRPQEIRLRSNQTLHIARLA